MRLRCLKGGAVHPTEITLRFFHGWPEAFAKHFADSDQWEVLVLGEGCCPKSSSSSPSSRSPSSSSSPSSPTRSPSSSDSSQPSSPPSSQSPSPSPPSSLPSDSSQSPSSKPSEPSSSPPSEQPPSQTSAQSDKSTAIVPASWSPTGYTALFIAEMPEVRFDDVMAATVTDSETLLAIDPKFLEVCEPGTIQVCGCVPDLPVLVGAAVVDGQVRLRLGARGDELPVTLTIRLTGIRKGFHGHRFPNRTAEQFLANEAFNARAARPVAGRRVAGGLLAARHNAPGAGGVTQ